MPRWNLYFDIAGRVVERDPSCDLVVTGGVAIESSETERLREEIAGVPKWRAADRDAVDAVSRLLARRTVRSFAAGFRTHTAAWGQFFVNGRRVQRLYSEADGSSITYLKPGNVMRTFLLGDCSVRLLAECAKGVTGPVVRDPTDRVPILADLVCDEEIHGDDNVRVYEQEWRKLVSMPNAFKQFGFTLHIESIVFADEEKEPLLQLPDHLAGAVSTIHGAGVAPPPGLSVADAESLIGAVEESGKLDLRFEDFAEPYPPNLQASAADVKQRAADVAARRRYREAMGKGR